jgi:2-haloacid dehalogenase
MEISGIESVVILQESRNMADINTVIFDLGGVLIDWNPDYVFRTIFSTDEQMKWFYKNICTPDWNEEQDAGRSLDSATEELVKMYPDYEGPIRAYYGRWDEMLGGPIQGTVDIFKEIKDNPAIRTFALTNWSAETFPVALSRYDFLDWFDGRLVSGEEKTRKPFPDIYQKLIDKFSIDPKTSLYVDDNVRNLAPAADLGMYAVHFQSPAQFRAQLKSVGVLSS